VPTSRLLLQGGQVIGIKSILPQIERLGRDTKVPACLAGIATAPIIIKPLQPLGRTLRDCSLANQRADKLRAWDNISIDSSWMGIHRHTSLLLSYLKVSLMYLTQHNWHSRHRALFFYFDFDRPLTEYKTASGETTAPNLKDYPARDMGIPSSKRAETRSVHRLKHDWRLAKQ